jgi:hypothetical protein
MKTIVGVKDLIVDNPEIIIDKFKDKNGWQLLVYPSEGTVGVFLEYDRSKDEDATIMFDLDKDAAIFLAKSIMASAELLED